MSESTRRGFLVATGGSAAAVAAMSLIGAAESANAASGAPATLPSDGPLVAFIETNGSGKITIFAGNGSKTVSDRDVVRWLYRSAQGR